LQHARVADVRTAIAEKPRCLGKRGEHIKLRQRGSGLLNRGSWAITARAREEQFIFGPTPRDSTDRFRAGAA